MRISSLTFFSLILSFDKARTVIGQYMPHIVNEARRGIELPILFLFGRSDSTISAMGANISGRLGRT